MIKVDGGASIGGSTLSWLLRFRSGFSGLLSAAEIFSGGHYAKIVDHQGLTRRQPRALLAALIGWTAAADEASDFKATARSLSAPEIMKLMIGNTFSGKPANGNEWFEFYDPNGTVRGIAAHDGKYSGEWWLDGDTFCTKFPAYNWQRCSTIWFNQTANKVLFWNSDGSADNALSNVITGNPQGL